MKLFQGDQLNIAGHKVPLAALGVVATIGAALLLLRGSQNANAAAVEQQQASGSGVFGGASGADYSGSLQNLQTEIQALLTQLQQPSGGGPGSGSQPGSGGSSGSGPNGRTGAVQSPPVGSRGRSGAVQSLTAAFTNQGPPIILPPPGPTKGSSLPLISGTWAR